MSEEKDNIFTKYLNEYFIFNKTTNQINYYLKYSLISEKDINDYGLLDKYFSIYYF